MNGDELAQVVAEMRKIVEGRAVDVTPLPPGDDDIMGG